MELTSCHSSGALDIEVAVKLVNNLCTPVVPGYSHEYGFDINVA
jgi:hypothetical protein